MTKYIMVEFPEDQVFMDNPRFDECYYTMPTADELTSALMVPENLYNQVYNNK